MASVCTTSVLSKFRGCMLGVLLGDCLGSPFEGLYPISKNELSVYFTNLLSGACSKNFSFTDDTAMTLSVASSLVENQKFDPVDMAQRFVTEFFHEPGRGYGMNVVAVFQALKDSEFKDVFLPAKLQFDGSGSYGNGASMRVSPVALFGNKRGEQYIAKTATDVSRLTHTHPYGYNGAILQCLAVHTALNLDASKEFDPVDFITCLQNKMETIATKKNIRPYSESLNKMKKIFAKKRDVSTRYVLENFGNDVSAHRSVPTAIFSFLKGFEPLPEFECSNPFVRTLYFAISMGGDTDTIASMAGSIAGAYHGADHIPEALKERCEILDEVIRLADELHEMSEKET